MSGETTVVETAGAGIEARVAKLETQVAFLDRKRQEYRDNWKSFCRDFVSKFFTGFTMNGKVVSLLVACLLVGAAAVRGGTEALYTDGDGNNIVTLGTDTSGRYNGTMSVIGAEGTDAKLELDADNGDDSADTWDIRSEATGNDLSIRNAGTERLNLTSAGVLSVGSATYTTKVTTPEVDTASGDLTLDPAGADVLVDGGLNVGGTTEPGDNNLRVEGTSALVGNVTVTGSTDLNGATTATNITMDTGSTLAAKTLTVATACTVTPKATLTGGFDANAASTCTNLTVDSGSTLTITGVTVTGLTDAGVPDTHTHTDGSIAHVDLAAVAPGYILVGNASSQAVAVAVSSDMTMATNGAVTIADNAVLASEVGAGTLPNDVLLPASVTWTNTQAIVIDGTTAVTTNQSFLSATGVTNTLVIVDGLIKAIN